MDPLEVVLNDYYKRKFKLFTTRYPAPFIISQLARSACILMIVSVVFALNCVRFGENKYVDKFPDVPYLRSLLEPHLDSTSHLESRAHYIYEKRIDIVHSVMHQASPFRFVVMREPMQRGRHTSHDRIRQKTFMTYVQFHTIPSLDQGKRKEITT